MSYKIKSSAIIHELLDDEAILANLDTGVYYSIRGSGIPIWQLLLSGHTLDSIVALFNEKYQKEIATPLHSFVHQLLKEELLVATAAGDAVDNHPPVPHLLWPKEFTSPLLEKYEEMKNLLMLDPIHEVDEQGWPSRSN